MTFALAVGLIAAAADGGTAMDVLLKQDLDAAYAAPQATIRGTLTRVDMSKGPRKWLGTALVLDDETHIVVTMGEPPAGWDKLVGRYISVTGRVSPRAPGDPREQQLLAPHLLSPGTPAEATRSLAALGGKQVVFDGVAEEGKAGLILLFDGAPLYVRGLDAWPKGITRGTRVKVRGVLRHGKFIPSPVVGPKGERSQGAEGEQDWLEAPEVLFVFPRDAGK